MSGKANKQTGIQSFLRSKSDRISTFMQSKELRTIKFHYAKLSCLHLVRNLLPLFQMWIKTCMVTVFSRYLGLLHNYTAFLFYILLRLPLVKGHYYFDKIAAFVCRGKWHILLKQTKNEEHELTFNFHSQPQGWHRKW